MVDASRRTELVLRRCAYWLSLRGGPATTNETEKRVHLPRENLVTQESLKQLLVRVSREEELLVMASLSAGAASA